MTATIGYTISNTINFQDAEIGDVPDPSTTLTPIYGNRNFSFDLNFSGTEDSSGNPIVITSVVTVAPTYLITSNVLATVTITKDPAQLVFPDEQYNFIRFETQEEFSYQNLDNIEQGLSIISWDTPTNEVITAYYEFVITYDVPLDSLTNQTALVLLNQELYWDFAPGLAKMQEQVTNSEY